MGKIINSADDFVSHTGFDSYGGGYLKTWRKHGLVDPKDPLVRYIDTWMHTQCLPQPRWVHSWQKIETRENKETKRVTREVWSDDWTCHEEELIVKHQYQRDDNGQRTDFPHVCASCRLIEVVYQLVTTGKFEYGGKLIARGKLSWIEPVFVFEGTDPSKNRVVHAAGLYNGYKDVESDSEDNLLLKEAGIFLTSAYQENALAKLKYLFAIVDHAEPSKGIQITEESGSLGDKVKQVVGKSRESLSTETDDAGNPFLHPFAIRWKYNTKKGIAFDKKYDAVKMEKIALTPEIETAIRSPAKDWFAHKLRVGDPKTLRATLERHATEAAKILPWNWIFDGAEEEVAARSNGNGATTSRVVASVPAAVAAPAPAPAAAAPATTVRRKVVKQEPPPPPPEPERIPCDDCGTMMLATASKCPNTKCGAVYEVEGSAPAPAPAPASTAGRPAARPPAPEADPSASDEEIPF